MKMILPLPLGSFQSNGETDTYKQLQCNRVKVWAEVYLKSCRDEIDT